MRFPSLLVLALGAVLVSNTQLRTLDRRTSAAPWKAFSTKNGDDAFTAYTKKSENGLAVLKVGGAGLELLQASRSFFSESLREEATSTQNPKLLHS